MNNINNFDGVNNGSLISNNIFSVVDQTNIKNQNDIVWTDIQDHILLFMIDDECRNSWKKIAQVVKKTPIQCYQRFNKIRPDIIRGKFSKEEDKKIIELVNIYGKNWSEISKVLKTRSGKQIRDRYLNVLDSHLNRGKFTEDEDKKLLRLFLKHGPKWSKIAQFFSNRSSDKIKSRYYSSLKTKLANYFQQDRFKDTNTCSYFEGIYSVSFPPVEETQKFTLNNYFVSSKNILLFRSSFYKTFIHF